MKSFPQLAEQNRYLNEIEKTVRGFQCSSADDHLSLLVTFAVLVGAQKGFMVHEVGIPEPVLDEILRRIAVSSARRGVELAMKLNLMTKEQLTEAAADLDRKKEGSDS